MPNEFIEKNDGYRQYQMKDGLLAGWNGEYMKDVRLKMIRGEKVSACEKCYLLESQGQLSLRQNAGLGNTGQYIKNCNPDGTIDQMPEDIELHFGNVCNLKCKMCSHYFSHMIGKEMLSVQEKDPEFFRWIQEQGGHVNNWSTGDLSEVHDWFKDKDILQRVFEDIHQHVKSVRVIGGEPTIIPEFWQMFGYMSSKGSLRHKHIKITTNGTNTNPKMTEWFSEAGSVDIMISLDALGDRNRYIRYPSDWDAIMKNISKYQELSLENSDVTYFVAPTPQILNVDQLTEMCLYFQDRGHPLSFNPDVVSPKILDYKYFPMEYKKFAIEKLTERISLVKNKRSVEDINRIIDVLKIEKNVDEVQQNIRNFVKYNDFMDGFRKTDSWRVLMPCLAEVLDKNL
jgi:sulfatase maturation enzyme AslB (radical SAM superfamily)